MLNQRSHCLIVCMFMGLIVDLPLLMLGLLTDSIARLNAGLHTFLVQLGDSVVQMGDSGIVTVGSQGQVMEATHMG